MTMRTKNRSVANRLMGSPQILLMLPLLALAQQPDQSPDSQLGNDRSISLTWERIVAGFVLLLIGIILTFRGYRHHRFTMFLAGFIAGCTMLTILSQLFKGRLGEQLVNSFFSSSSCLLL